LAVFTTDFFTHVLQHDCSSNLPSVVMRREISANGISKRLRLTEDYEFWVGLWCWLVLGCLKPEQLVYTLHEANSSLQAAGSAADHAPQLPLSLNIMSLYPRLSDLQRGLIGRQAARMLFDRTYRSRLRSHWVQAARLHLRSARSGLRLANTLWKLLPLTAIGS
jgi:hypothetical protein